MTFEVFRQLIADITQLPVEMITEEASFREDLAIDSLQMVNLIIEVSTRLQVSFENVQSMDQFSTVKTMYETFAGSVVNESSTS
ncbi:hypothetical protein GCM10011391_05400 [Pullulanibacillus camelliae]|uniref:Carrier domain-containing protein n=1 Tax=Pullulanibacillus camelliae TaxID=1707096 RepID=A0A8J2YAM4_9BACL|nr:phosphopantetheine-binding protein [Pullulanibacillus camelliae]GGE29809.1 hypothetical protein GCM10011391_05400 [Pullulanibacillus camelliae]